MRIYFVLPLLFCLGIVCAQSTYTSGGKLNPAQAVMDIRHYTVALNIDISHKAISGNTDISLVLSTAVDSLVFNLLDSMNVQQVWIAGRAVRFNHSHDLVTAYATNMLPPGKTDVKIKYAGIPHVAIRPPWDDGFTWTTDLSGNPWVAVTAEAGGGKLYFPCKDHPSDEPDDGADMLITVPKGLVVAGPGLLISVTTNQNLQTYHWQTKYTINNYSIVFNVGKYKVVTRNYSTVKGNKVPIQFYVLEEHAKYASHHIDVFEESIRQEEKYFGEYPWVKEKIGIVETPHLGMEHQTMNAYGNKFRYTTLGGKDYDWLLHHEFGHEWWGNKVTVKDWADYWIHEGICSFGDALYIRDAEGEKAYIENFKRSALTIKNDLPVVMGKDIDEEKAYHGDIYTKGAFFMHTLRYVMGDAVFFPAIKSFVTSPAYTYSNLVTTENIQQFFSDTSGIMLKPLFDLYLRGTQKLEINIHQTGKATYTISLANIDMMLPLDVVTANGTTKINVGKTPVIVNSSAMIQVDPDCYYLKKVIID